MKRSKEDLPPPYSLGSISKDGPFIQKIVEVRYTKAGNPVYSVEMQNTSDGKKFRVDGMRHRTFAKGKQLRRI
jgi:hypothetical protein